MSLNVDGRGLVRACEGSEPCFMLAQLHIFCGVC